MARKSHLGVPTRFACATAALALGAFGPALGIVGPAAYADPDDDSPSAESGSDEPLQRFICRLGIGHWRHPLRDATAEYVWAHDFNEADQIARDDHPTVPPFEYISWSRCDPA